MTINDFVEMYVNNPDGKAVLRQNFFTDGVFTNYSTDICQIVGKVARLNIRKYSRTTSKLQSLLRYALERNGYTIEEYNGEPCTYWNYGYCSSDNKWTINELKARGIF